MLKIYQKYLINKLTKTFFFIFFIFFTLVFIMGVIQELNFFSNEDVSFYFPFFLVFLNLPSILYEILPFIIILALIILIIDLNENGELITFKNNGLNNSKILQTLSLASFILGLLIMLIFYNISAILKFNYLSLKQNYTNDSKYLATITENGLWIKDEIDEQIIFVNAKRVEKNYLEEVDILILDKSFNYLSTILVEKIDILNNTWILESPIIFYEDNSKEELEEFKIKSNFNYDKIKNLYSELNSLTILGLLELKNSYKSVNYSTTDIDYQIQKVLITPIYFVILSVISFIVCFNFKQDNKFILITLGILISVMIHYITSFFGIVGKNEKISITLSVWGPLTILILFSLVGLIRINEK
jgi:lipopolysaccharide export system permease protein